MDDQVGQGTRYAKFGGDRFTGVFWGDVRFLELSFFFYIGPTYTRIYLFFFAQPTGQTPERILTHNIPKRAESCKVQTLSLIHI